jgi:type IV secretion system protein TrbJ
MERRIAWLVFIALLFAANPAHALFGVGDVVFDPTMYASQLQQLQQETATVTNLAQQLQYAVKNTTGGYGGVWQSNQQLLTNLGNVITEQEGLSYTLNGLAQQFNQTYPAYNVTTVPRPESTQGSAESTLNTLNGALASVQAQAQNFQAEQATLSMLEARNQTAVGGLQAAQVSNEIALAQVQQIQMLRQLIIALTNSHNVAAANQVNSQVQSDLAAQAELSAPAPAQFPDALSGSPDAAPPQP